MFLKNFEIVKAEINKTIPFSRGDKIRVSGRLKTKLQIVSKKYYIGKYQLKKLPISMIC